jgi:hypothetical protein
VKSEPPNWTFFALIVVVGVGTLLLANAGHILWPTVLIIAGAYIVPTLYVKIRNSLAARRQGPTENEMDPEK